MIMNFMFRLDLILMEVGCIILTVLWRKNGIIKHKMIPPITKVLIILLIIQQKILLIIQIALLFRIILQIILKTIKLKLIIKKIK